MSGTRRSPASLPLSGHRLTARSDNKIQRTIPCRAERRRPNRTGHRGPRLAAGRGSIVRPLPCGTANHLWPSLLDPASPSRGFDRRARGDPSSKVRLPFARNGPVMGSSPSVSAWTACPDTQHRGCSTDAADDAAALPPPKHREPSYMWFSMLFASMPNPFHCR